MDIITPHGKINSDEMREALMYQISQFIKDPTEDVLYFHQKQGQFMNMRWKDEHIPQIHKWKSMNMHSYQCNRKEIQVGRNKVFVNVYQPEGDNCGLSLLSVGLGTMVDGFTYIYKKKIHADTAHKMLAKEYKRPEEKGFSIWKPEHDDPENATAPQKWTLDLKEKTYPKKRNNKKKKGKGKKKKKK
jgi:hypothetical protein